MPAILAIQEAEIRRIVVWSQPGQIAPKTLSQEISSLKRAGGVTQGVGPEFKLQYHKKEHKTIINIYVPNVSPIHKTNTNRLKSTQEWMTLMPHSQ
jgi:hypothetical protein